jgi:hypothetical protein
LFDEQNVRVLLNNYGKPTSNDKMPSEPWRIMEESVVSFMGKKNITFMWDRYYKTPKLYTCVKGEPVYVEVTLQNTLAIEVPVDKLQLTAKFIPLDPENTSNTPYIAEAKTLELKPLESLKILLKITPTEEGELHITGLDWVISGSIRGTKAFKLKGKRKNDNKNDKNQISYDADTRLDLLVIPSQPLLDVQFSFPERLWNGEIKKVSLEIKNIGKQPMTNIGMKISHPNFMSFTNSTVKDEMIGEEFNEEKTINQSEPDSKLSENLSLLRVKDTLEPEEVLSIPFYVRGTSTGVQSMKVLFYYETNEPKMPVRYVRFAKDVEVIDSLQFKTFTVPCRKLVDEFIVGITIGSMINDRRIEIDQITSVSPKWRILPLNFDSQS